MIYIFAIQLVSKRTLQGLVERFKGSRVAFGALMAVVGLVTVVAVFFKNKFIDMSMQQADAEVPMSVIGKTLMGADKFQ